MIAAGSQRWPHSPLRPPLSWSALRTTVGQRDRQYLSIRYTERLALAGIEPSVGSVGDSYDSAPLGRLLCNRLSGNAWLRR
jgi:transposase InsO family protein